LAERHRQGDALMQRTKFSLHHVNDDKQLAGRSTPASKLFVIIHQR
jgi:hypothetical protein